MEKSDIKIKEKLVKVDGRAFERDIKVFHKHKVNVSGYIRDSIREAAKMLVKKGKK